MGRPDPIIVVLLLIAALLIGVGKRAERHDTSVGRVWILALPLGFELDM